VHSPCGVVGRAFSLWCSG